MSKVWRTGVETGICNAMHWHMRMISVIYDMYDGGKQKNKLG